MNKNAKSMLVWFIMASILVMASWQLLKKSDGTEVYNLPFSEFVRFMNEKKIAKVEIGNEWISGMADIGSCTISTSDSLASCYIYM